MNAEVQKRYEQLARRFEADGEPRRRDDCLVLAADAAQNSGQLDEAERLRQALLRNNPYHLLCPYDSMAEALQSGDVRDYIAALRRQLSPERAEQLLREKHRADEPTYKVVPQTQVPTPHEITPLPDLPPPKPRLATPAPPRQNIAVRPAVPKPPAPSRQTASPTAAPAESRRRPDGDAASPAGRLAATLLFLVGVALVGAACFFAFVRPLME
jgi:hypothetical protein